MRYSIVLFAIIVGIISAAAAVAVPAAPTVLWPVSGKTTNSTTPRVHWSGASHTSYQVRLNTANNPDLGIVWDSGQTSSSLNQAVAGVLTNGNTYYAFARIADGTGWSNWSATGYSFTVNTSFQWARHGNVRLVGYGVEDDSGPFLGLGVSYMQALRRCKYDRDRFRDDLAFLASNGFRYMRALSMVGWYDAWAGKEIAPVSFTNNVGTYVPAWSDYWQQLADMIDIAYDEYGIRTELTIFADAQLIPVKADRITHMQTILNNLPGRQHKMMHYEVCNEAWQNGFPGTQGEADLREFAAYLAARATVPVAITSNHSSLSDMENLYSGSAANLCTYHLERDIGTFEGGWLPVRDSWKCYPSTLPPTSSNEPIGPGSSVASETDPIKLVSAACFAWIAKLPMYVYHTDAGVFGVTRFEDKPGVSSYKYLEDILPPDLPNWTRNDGKESAAPFTAYCNGVANTYWTDNTAGTDGCHRNIGGIKSNQFVCYPQGIRSGGLTLRARRPLVFTVYNPMTGAVVLGPLSKLADESVTLTAGPGAYIIKGSFVVGAVTNFVVTHEQTTNSLSWTNPADAGFAGTVVRFRTNDYPSSPTDGTLLCDRTALPGSGDSFAHTPVNPTLTYYYAAWGYDGVPLYSSSAAFASTFVLPDWLNEPFNNYSNSNLGGQGGWGTVGISSAQVQSSVAKGGTGKAALMDTVPSGLSTANQICFTDKTSGYCYLSFDVAEDASGTTGQMVGYVTIYGSSSSNDIARLQIQKGRMFMEYGSGSTGVVATTMTNLAWYNIRIGLNVGTRKMDVWLDGVKKVNNVAWKGTGSNISKVVISSDRNTNLTSQKLYVDTLRFQPTTGIVDTVRDDGVWTPSLSTLHFDFDSVSGIPEYRYAIGTTSGGADTKGWTSCGTTIDNTVTGLSLSETQTYYVSVQCSAGGGVWGGSVVSDGIAVAPGITTVQVAKGLADSSSVKALRGKLVSAPFAGYFYIQEPSVPSGLKVISSASVAAGDLVDVAGSMGGSGSERAMNCTGNPVSKTSPGPGGPYPVFVGTASVGGVALNEYTPGVAQGTGPNNIGLYVTVFGKVTQRKTTDPKYLYIDDGRSLVDGTNTDGTANVGVRVLVDPATHPESYVAVTGVVSCFISDGLRPCIAPAQVLAFP